MVPTILGLFLKNSAKHTVLKYINMSPKRMWNIKFLYENTQFSILQYFAFYLSTKLRDLLIILYSDKPLFMYLLEK